MEFPAPQCSTATVFLYDQRRHYRSRKTQREVQIKNKELCEGCGLEWLCGIEAGKEIETGSDSQTMTLLRLDQGQDQRTRRTNIISTTLPGVDSMHVLKSSLLANVMSFVPYRIDVSFLAIATNSCTLRSIAFLTPIINSPPH